MTEIDEAQPWLRLDKRMLLVHPVTEGAKFLPVLLVSFVLGAQSGNHTWGLITVAVILVLALLRWFTTFYRIGPVNIELRTGLFQKKLLSVPRSRIRSVDVEANLMHRVLGLSVVKIGTGTQGGVGDEKFLLNALDAKLVPALRADLLAKAPVTDNSGEPAAALPAYEIAQFSPSWVRYAPFSSTGLLMVLAPIGLAFQYGLVGRIEKSDTVSNGIDDAAQFGLLAVVGVAFVVLIVVASALACVRYLLAYANLTVVDDTRVLHISHGLLKTRSTSLDRARLRGSTLKEPLLLRLVGGAKLDGIMTGVSAAKRESSLVLPQAPATQARRVMAHLTGDTAQASVPLVSHGPAALRRRFTRALIPVAIALVVLVVAEVVDVVLWQYWLALGVIAVALVGLAIDRYRGLGHAVMPGWLITQSGSLDRDRDCLQSAGIIGWTVRQTFFQRRAGVATVVAATPAGKRHYDVIDLPIEQAWSLIEAVRPGSGDIWVHTATPD